MSWSKGIEKDKGMATHSSVPAWRIPRTKEPGGLQAMGLQRVARPHDFHFHFKLTHSSTGKESACNAGDPGSILGSGRFAGEGIGYPLQYSYPENSTDRRAWQATVHGITKVQQD